MPLEVVVCVVLSSLQPATSTVAATPTAQFQGTLMAIVSADDLQRSAAAALRPAVCGRWRPR
ncbi:MAG: hypothetical protein DRI90_01260 [Deltaproteobacteria bacterium]|nr:MAG: hypothetical protein DRI90_01260 [Deltaproteobacteria bacterium]